MELSKLTLEDVSSVRKRIEVEIPAGSVTAELDRAFAVVGRQARLRGFRPGKAPRTVLERVFGDQVRREVVDRLVGESLQQAVEEHRLAVVGTPDIDAETLRPGEALRYAATVDIRPAVALADLNGLAAERTRVVVTDDDVDRVLASLRESVAQLRPVEDRQTVEAGDVVTADLVSQLEGADATRRDDVLLEAGSGSFPLALERQLVGQHVGARLSLEVPYPADYAGANLAGKTARFDVTIKAIRTKELPPLDDDFARDHGRADSLDEFRARVRADLERQGAQRAEARVREAILDQLLARHPFDVPESLVERRGEALLASLDLQLPEGPAGEQALARLRAEIRPRAERDVRADLVLEAIAAREGIEVAEDAVDAEIQAAAAREGRAPERIRALYERPEARAALRSHLLRERALAHVMSHARIVPVETPEQVARGNQSR